MNEPEALTPEAELQALKDLVESDGWRIYQAHIAKAWGDAACLDQIDQALAKEQSADALAELAITKRIRDTFKGVRAEAGWVERRVADLVGIVKNKSTTSMFDRFASLRRVPRA